MIPETGRIILGLVFRDWWISVLVVAGVTLCSVAVVVEGLAVATGVHTIGDADDREVIAQLLLVVAGSNLYFLVVAGAK